MKLTPEQEETVSKILNNFPNGKQELTEEQQKEIDEIPKETQQKIIERCRQKNIDFTIELIDHFDIRQLRFIFYVCSKILMEDDELNDYEYNDDEKITNYIKNFLQHLNSDQIDFVYNACEALIEEYPAT